MFVIMATRLPTGDYVLLILYPTSSISTPIPYRTYGCIHTRYVEVAMHAGVPRYYTHSVRGLRGYVLSRITSKCRCLVFVVFTCCARLRKGTSILNTCFSSGTPPDCTGTGIHIQYVCYYYCPAGLNTSPGGYP